jgi:PilZ domain
MDRRTVIRNRVLRAATIEFGGASVNCVVRNISIAGAALDVSNPVGIPEDFTLAFRADGLRMFCHVNWRSGKRIGVSFD